MALSKNKWVVCIDFTKRCRQPSSSFVYLNVRVAFDCNKIHILVSRILSLLNVWSLFDHIHFGFMDKVLPGCSPLFGCYGSGCSNLICCCCGDTYCSTFTVPGILYDVAFITHQSLFLVNTPITLEASFPFVV